MVARLLMQIKCIKRDCGYAHWLRLCDGKTVVRLKYTGDRVSRVNVIVAPYKSRLIAEEYGPYIKTTVAVVICGR